MESKKATKKESKEKIETPINENEIVNDILSMEKLDKYFTDKKFINLTPIDTFESLVSKIDKYHNELNMYITTFCVMLKMSDDNHIPLTEVYKTIIENTNKVYSVNPFISESFTISCAGIGENGIDCNTIVHPTALCKVANYDIMLISPQIIVDYITPSLDISYKCIKDKIEKFFKLVNEFIILAYIYHKNNNKNKKYNYRKKNINNPNTISKIDLQKMQKYGDFKPKYIKKDEKIDHSITNAKLDLSSIDN
ncbi:ORF MSV120 hypothetical protein [Melanoplus sanguinipes entomopoxvirus]|uniref:Uncharacterized protein n=1 Tax=Melanoplus sanguinipes entomopoxvirus TaxID=83191 RepID=Q9YVX2_MSEPV|nr:ORF MSV120 hypothetical protein [Melanoplus sanguinipes entomopoxvirus]AAC97662.1 ORF MSV120 hypothetical protein [Melanoplus sanguinipes entomopoxvirus 'O']